MAPNRNERPSQRARGVAHRRARGGGIRGTSEPRGGRAGRGTRRGRGRPPSGSSSDPGNVSTSRRYNKMAPPEPIIAQAPAWKVGDGPQKADGGSLKLLELGTHSDALVICGDRVWPVHKMPLLSRSAWFAQEIEKSDATKKPEFNLTNDFTPADVDVILYTIYGNRLPEPYYDLDDKSNSLAKYCALFNIGVLFGVASMRDDSLTLLGRFCDRHLERICSFDRQLSAAQGVVVSDGGNNKHAPTDDLCLALHEAFLKHDSYPDQKAQSLLANFVFAGRAVLLADSNVRTIVQATDRIAAALWHASYGRDLTGWLPSTTLLRERHFQFDHSKKTQHPERCELCDETFDARDRKRVMFDPHKVVIRPVGYCLTCVDKAGGEAQSIFRKQGKTDRERAASGEGGHGHGHSQGVKVKKEPNGEDDGEEDDSERDVKRVDGGGSDDDKDGSLDLDA